MKLNTYPDREGIETTKPQQALYKTPLNTYPDREGIETMGNLSASHGGWVEYLPRPRGD